jgi:hypothetical protein
MGVTAGDEIAVRAAELAELIVDEISQADHDWHALERQARELVTVLATARARSAGAHRGGMTESCPTSLTPPRRSTSS